MSQDILIAGVGGQGTILASRILASAGILSGQFVRTGETIGMSQRGGCVVSHVRIGSEEKSSYLPMGGGGLLIGFELAEAARNIGKISRKGNGIINTQQIKPVPVSLGLQSYNTEEMKKYLARHMKQSLFLDGYHLAEEAGSVKSVNVVLIGAACGAGYLEFEKDILLEAVCQNVPQRFVQLNSDAFQLGYEFARKKRGIQ